MSLAFFGESSVSAPSEFFCQGFSSFLIDFFVRGFDLVYKTITFDFISTPKSTSPATTRFGFGIARSSQL
jgi:hypothetical protein